MITATYDLTGGWTFDGEPDTQFGVRFADGEAERLRPRRLKFGWTVKVNGDETASLSWPPDAVVIRELSTARVFPYRVDAAPDDDVTLLVWASNGGSPVDGEATFVVPRPDQPYPSWVWVDGQWKAPVPYPDDGGDYMWDEDVQGWVMFDPDA